MRARLAVVGEEVVDRGVGIGATRIGKIEVIGAIDLVRCADGDVVAATRECEVVAHDEDVLREHIASRIWVCANRRRAVAALTKRVDRNSREALDRCAAILQQCVTYAESVHTPVAR